MKVSYNWLQSYFDKNLPSSDELAKLLTMHSFEVGDVEEVDGDYVLDVDVLPNRAHDAYSHDGVAREISAILDIAPSVKERELTKDESLKTSEHASLSVNDDKSVPRALKRVVFDVEVKESPDWLREHLMVLGHNSINNIVDATNYIMLETGQPVHAFDFDKLSGEKKEIIIRNAEEGEKITTLDGEEYVLDSGMLVIADSEKALDIAGIKGGAVSGIDENTKKVLLSVCNFNPTSIRNTSQELGLVTEASKIFGYGIAPELAEVAMERLSALVAEVSGGRVAGDVLDEYPRPRGKYHAGVSTKEVNELLGTSIKDSDVEKALKSLGFEVKKVNPADEVVKLAKELVGKPYKYGASITYDAPNEFDCSSLTSYLFANAGISIPRMTVDQLVFGDEIGKEELSAGDLVFSFGNGDETKVHSESKEFMTNTPVEGGVNHVGIYIGDGMIIHASGSIGSVTEEKLDESESFKDLRGFRRISSVSSERFAVVVPPYRLDIRGEEDLIEEVGRIYGYEKISDKKPHEAEKKPEINKTFYYVNKIRDILVGKGFSELYTYSLVENGKVELENKLASDKGFLREDLRILKDKLEPSKRNAPLEDEINIFEIGTVFGGDNEHISLGIASTNKKIAEDAVSAISSEIGGLDIKEKDGLYEGNISIAIKDLPVQDSYEPLEIGKEGVSFKPISQYPFVLRDIAVWTPEGTSAEDVQKLIQEGSNELLHGTKLFDAFEKDGRVSYAFRLAFQSDSRTLSDGDVNKIMDVITQILNSKNGWDVR